MDRSQAWCARCGAPGVVRNGKRARAPEAQPDFDLQLRTGRDAPPMVLGAERRATTRGASRWRERLRDPHSVREAFVLKELLDRPAALRRGRSYR